MTGSVLCGVLMGTRFDGLGVGLSLSSLPPSGVGLLGLDILEKEVQEVPLKSARVDSRERIPKDSRR